MTELENFYNKLTEPNKSCMLALREIIVNYDANIKTGWAFAAPFFYYNNKMLLFLWIDKKTKKPYINFADGVNLNHAKLEVGDRKKFALLRCNPNKDLPIKVIKELLKKAIDYNNLKYKKIK